VPKPMITSKDNEKLKLIRKLAERKHREREGLFAAEGEDLIAAAEAADWQPEFVLRSGVDVEPALLDAVSTLGSGTRVIGVYRERWIQSTDGFTVYLHGIGDPGNVGTIIRTADALLGAPVTIGPGCADPFGPKAVRASMGSIFARPPARARAEDLPGTRLALTGDAARTLRELELHGPVVLMVGGERAGLGPDALNASHVAARIPIRDDGPDSLNAAMAATVALYELAHRMAPDG
jgi:RNA methyltransferase, TrmH family